MADKEQRASIAAIIAGGLVTIHPTDSKAVAKKAVELADAILAEVEGAPEKKAPVDDKGKGAGTGGDKK